MADTREDAKEYQGLKGRTRRALEKDGAIGEAFSEFARGFAWRGNGEKAEAAVLFPAIVGLLVVPLAAGMISEEETHVANNYTDTQIASGLSQELGYQAIKRDGARNPVVLVREGDVYRFYTTQSVARNNDGGMDLEWSFVSSQGAVLNEIHQTLRALEEARRDLDDPLKAGHLELPDFLHFERVSTLDNDLNDPNIIQRWSTPPRTTSDDRPVDLKAELDEAIEQWRMAVDAVARGRYGFIESEARGDGNSNGDTAQVLTLAMEGLESQPYSGWVDNIVFLGKYSYAGY